MSSHIKCQLPFLATPEQKKNSYGIGFWISHWKEVGLLMLMGMEKAVVNVICGLDLEAYHSNVLLF